MNSNIDIIIIGSGPSGVSAAFPLVDAGLRVLMLDVGKKKKTEYIATNYLNLRQNDPHQSQWMLGKNLHALRAKAAVSPKLRIPELSYVFDGYHENLKIKNSDFTLVGSLAAGGLSNAWGAGVAQFSAAEFASFPFTLHDIEASYAAVCQRIGISGKSDDDLSAYFGVDNNALAPVAMDEIHHRLFSAYNKKKSKLNARGFRMGRSRVAVLTADKESRKACTLSGNCLWGCFNRAIYSAADDLEKLKTYSNFFYQSGFLANELIKHNEEWQVNGTNTLDGQYTFFRAKKIILAAGTLSSTKIAAKALEITTPIKLLSSPTAAFLLWMPGMFGAQRKSGFGLGQLSFTLRCNDCNVFGSTFATNGIPIAEFASHVPLRRANALKILSVLLDSCVVGNVFLPGHLTNAYMQLGSNDELLVSGNFSEAVAPIMNEVAAQLRKNFLPLGGVVLPGSFTVGRPGGDIHYAGTFPMRKEPVTGETDALGQIKGLQNVYIVDGAALPILPEKSHTLTIMANADRVAKQLIHTVSKSL